MVIRSSKTRLKRPMVVKADGFDKVVLHFFCVCAWKDSWKPGDPFPEGWGLESEARQKSYVATKDYDKLLALYRDLKARQGELG